MTSVECSIHICVEAPLAAVTALSLRGYASVGSGHCNASSFLFAKRLELRRVTWGPTSEQPFSSPGTNSWLDWDLDWDITSAIPYCVICFFHFLFIFTLTRLSRACCWEASSKHDAATTMLHAGDATLLSVWFLLQTWCSVWWPKSSVLVSPDHRSFFQLTSEPSTCRLANYSPRCHKSGFLIATLP